MYIYSLPEHHLQKKITSVNTTTRTKITLAEIFSFVQVETDYFQDITLAEVSFNVLVEGSLNPVMSEQLLVKISSLLSCYFVFPFFNPALIFNPGNF